MAKATSVYVCSDCGHEHPKWQGRCDSCGAWNTLQEFKIGKSSTSAAKSSSTVIPLSKKLDEIDLVSINRLTTGVEEIDRVFGGGFVTGSLILLSGEPGIGKSTLLLQIVSLLSSKTTVLYWSAEESVEQVASRAERLQLKKENISLISTTDASFIFSDIKADVLIVDSIQTVALPDIPAAAGSVTQVRSVLQAIQIWAKENNKIVIVVGHVTKEGVVAGPKTLEHLVDVVASLEGDSNHDIRILKTSKNRFGPTNEVGVFSMVGTGLSPITNPSEIFLNERLQGVPGSTVTPTIEGTRVFLVEVQALATKSYMTFPKRTSSGIDSKRLDIIIAILETRAGIKIYDKDIYLNIIGGIKVTEPSVDLAIAVSIASAALKITVPPKWCIFGEMGLAGEIRSVKGKQSREREVKRLGFELIPEFRTISQVIDLLKKQATK